MGFSLGQAISSGLNTYQQGMRFNADQTDRDADRKYQAEQRARATMMQTRDDASYELDQKANGAAQQALQSLQQPQGLSSSMQGAQLPANQFGPPEPGLSGPQQQAAPRKLMPADYLKAFDAQANVYAGAGDVQKMMATEAKAYPLRTQVRNEGLTQALANFQAHKDPVQLAKDTYPLLRDGKEIASADNSNGMIQFTMTDGSKPPPMDANKIVDQIHYAMANPEKVAEMELQTRIKQMEIAATGEQTRQTEGVKGKEMRLTEADKAKSSLGLEAEKSKSALGLADVNNKASMDRTTQQGKNSLAVAGIGANATIRAAQIRNPVDNSPPAPSDGFSPAAIENAAARYNLDGTLPPMGMGKEGSLGRRAIMNRAAELSTGTGTEQRINQMDNKSASSALTQLQKSQTMNAAFEKNANMNADLALNLSKQNDRTGIPLLNAGLQAWRTGTGSPEATQFSAANQTFVSEYAKIMSGGMGNGPVSDSARGKAEKLLTTSMTSKQYEGNVRLLQTEMSNRMKGFEDQGNALKDRMRASQSQPSKPAQTTPTTSSSAGGSVNSVTTPDGQVHSFPSAAAAAQFKKAAGL